MAEIEHGGDRSPLATRAARCVERMLAPDSVLQMLVVADEAERAEARRLVGSAAVRVLTRPEALEFILAKR